MLESCQKDQGAKEDSGLPLAKETIWASTEYNNLNGIKDIKNVKKTKTKTENTHWSREDVRKPTARDNHYSKHGD